MVLPAVWLWQNIFKENNQKSFMYNFMFNFFFYVNSLQIAPNTIQNIYVNTKLKYVKAIASINIFIYTLLSLEVQNVINKNIWIIVFLVYNLTKIRDDVIFWNVFGSVVRDTTNYTLWVKIKIIRCTRFGTRLPSQSFKFRV